MAGCDLPKAIHLGGEQMPEPWFWLTLAWVAVMWEWPLPDDESRWGMGAGC